MCLCFRDVCMESLFSPPLLLNSCGARVIFGLQLCIQENIMCHSSPPTTAAQPKSVSLISGALHSMAYNLCKPKKTTTWEGKQGFC